MHPHTSPMHPEKLYIAVAAQADTLVFPGQAGFRINRSCMGNVYTLNEIVQGRLREDKRTYAFFLDIQKAYDSVWHDGLWYKLWDMGVKGRMWHVLKKMYESSKSAVLLEGEKSDTFTIEQGVAQGCSLSPILFSVFVNDLLKEVQWNPSIVATIRDQPFGLYRGVATSQGLFYIIDKTCTCMV